MTAPLNPIKILALSASPTNTDRLRLDVEMRGLREELERSLHRDRVILIQEGAVRVDDLSRAMLKHKPDIVHFSGHGTGSQGLVFEDDQGIAQLVSTAALSRLFQWGRNTVKCVFLNACLSEDQAKAIHQHIDCVLGMRHAVSDATAIKFAAKFYQALLDGEAYPSAYDYACTALELSGSREAATPRLFNRVDRPDPLALVTVAALPDLDEASPTASSTGLRDMPPSGHHNRSITIGGAVTGSAITSGDNNIVTVNFQPAALPEPASVNIKAEIEALRSILATLAAPDRRKIDNALDDIEDELQKPDPDKDEVGKALDRAMTYAQKANGFAEAINQLRPHVENTASWLGKHWYKLLPLVGLTI